MKLKWDQVGEKIYELGVDHGVLYRHKITAGEGGKTTISEYANAYVWNGLTAVNESSEGGEANALYADNIKYLELMSAEEFNATIEAYTYPDEFAECDGSAEVVSGLYITQQTRQPFGFSYRTKIGNDVVGEDYGYKLHLCYALKAAPSDKNRETINESPDAVNFSWEATSTPVEITVKKDDGSSYKPTAHLIIDSTKVDKTKLAKLEDILYGTDETEGRLPLPDEVINLFKAAA